MLGRELDFALCLLPLLHGYGMGYGRRGNRGHVDVLVASGSSLRALRLRRVGSAPVGTS